MSVYGTAAALARNADRIKTAIDTYSDVQSIDSALEVAQALSQFLGVAAVAGLTEIELRIAV